MLIINVVFCGCGTQNFKADLILTFAHRLVEVTRCERSSQTHLGDLEFLGHFWPDFQNIYAYPTQNFKANLNQTFAQRYYEVKFTRIEEFVPY